MRFPNKITRYKDSLLYIFPLILNQLLISDSEAMALYKKIKNQRYPIKITLEEFVQALDCLFILNKIRFKEGSEVIQYVN